MLVTWLLSQLHWQRPGFWLLASIIVGTILLVVGQTIATKRQRQLRLLHWLLVPYMGLLAGGLSPRLMGLSDIDWVAGLGLGIALMSIIWVLLILIRATLHLDPTTLRGYSISAEHGAFERFIAAGAQEFHWTFLRAATWEALLTYPITMEAPGYWALWFASLLALPGIVIQYRSAAQCFIAAVVLITTATLYFYTRNFWLCWLLHASVQFLLGQMPVYQKPLNRPEELTR